MQMATGDPPIEDYGTTWNFNAGRRLEDVIEENYTELNARLKLLEEIFGKIDEADMAYLLLKYK